MKFPRLAVLILVVSSAVARQYSVPAQEPTQPDTNTTSKTDATDKKKPAAQDVPPEMLAAQVKQIFRTRCFECHGGKSTQEGVKILDHDLLVNTKKKVTPGDPDHSILYQRLTAIDDDERMPPPGNPRPSAEEIETVRRWIAAGAPAFPEDVAVPETAAQDQALRDVVGVDYVLGKILMHIRSVPQQNRPLIRYFSTNHLLMAGATRQELVQQRDALAKVINHLSWEMEIVPLKCIDEPTGTIFCVDIRDLGWDKRPFVEYPGAANERPSTLNLFDLALLEYPYGVAYEDSDTFDNLAKEYLALAKPVRPIPYVRADWFVSAATTFPLYEDFLQLPFQLEELQKRLGVQPDDGDRPPDDARRAGMTVSGVSRNNRVVQRQPISAGAFWRSFDFAGSKGVGNMFKDPVNLHPTGGEMIFNLPNGLQGYFVTNAVGRRLEAAPTEIVTDKFAEDKTVRNGLSCMRCHEQGIRGFKDTIRQAVLRLPGSTSLDKRQILRLYSEQKEMDGLIEQDTARFMAAANKALGHTQEQEPITPVSRRFIDGPLQITTAAAELGQANAKELEIFFRSPQFTSLGLEPLAAGGVVRRDTWEDYFDQVVRGLGFGIPIVPLDGLSRLDYPSANPPFDVKLATSKPNNVFAPGDEMTITVTNGSDKTVYFELMGTSADGKQVVMTKPGLSMAAKGQYRFPPDRTMKVKPSVGKEHITLFASDQPLPAGRLLRGQYTTDRVVHDFYPLYYGAAANALPGPAGQPTQSHFDPARLVKKTIEIETK